jgi:formate hydrogenlyase subunit 4
MFLAMKICLQLLVVLSLSPLLIGVINRVKAFFGGRQGPPVLQPYYDLWRLFHKGTVQSTVTTWLFRFGPVAALVTTLVAALFVPLAQAPAPLHFTGDLLLFIYLLALGRFFLVLSSLDTGSPFEGMGVAREITFGCISEPAMFFNLLVLAKVAGSLELQALLGGSQLMTWQAAGAPLLLVLTSWFLLTLADNCRIPFDDPNTHLELTMVHEVIVLDHSGPMLGTLQLAAAAKLFLFSAVIVRLAVPLPMLPVWATWPVFLVAVLLVAVLLGIVESVMARLRMPLVPHLLTAAGVIGAFGLVLEVAAP